MRTKRMRWATAAAGLLWGAGVGGGGGKGGGSRAPHPRAGGGPYTWFRIVSLGGPDNTAWVYKDEVRVVGDLLTVPAVTPPPTPTVRPTSTPGGPAAEGAATPE